MAMPVQVTAVCTGMRNELVDALRRLAVFRQNSGPNALFMLPLLPPNALAVSVGFNRRKKQIASFFWWQLAYRRFEARRLIVQADPA